MKILGEVVWKNGNEDYDRATDVSRVTVVKEDGKCYLKVACNDQERVLQIYEPPPGGLVVDQGRLETAYPICADTDRDVAYVAERLGLRLV